MGLYLDDWERLGMLAAQAHRAARLITDTGLHAFGWTREQAIEKLVAGGSPRGESEIEVDRYIALPAQALAYMVGMVEIEDARRRTEEKEGAAFDLRTSTTGCSRSGSCPCRRSGASSAKACSRASGSSGPLLGLLLGLSGLEQQVVEDPRSHSSVGLGEHRAGRERERSRLPLTPRIQPVADEPQRRARPHGHRPAPTSTSSNPAVAAVAAISSADAAAARPQPPDPQHRHGRDRFAGPLGATHRGDVATS